MVVVTVVVMVVMVVVIVWLCDDFGDGDGVVVCW